MNIGIWHCIFVILVVICIICILFGIYSNKYFQRLGIAHAIKPIPLIGNMKSVFLGQEHLLQLVYRTYNTHPKEKYIGIYAFNTPTVIIKDVELIKKITVKDFDHFIDHKVFMDEDDDPLFGRNLFFLKGQKWRDMRYAMSPAYTGSKMKTMLPFIIECAEQIISHIKNQSIANEKNNNECLTLEMKDIFTRFTNDVIASTAFGVRVDSLRERDNKFYLMGKKATNFSGIQFFKFFGFSSFPRIMKFFGISLFPNDVQSFFRKLIRDTIESRDKLNIIRHDMIHLLVLAKKGSLSYEYDPVYGEDTGFTNYNNQDTQKREWSHDDLTAQAVAFLLAGFDTSSSLLCFTAYELSINRDIQKQLQAEIDDVLATIDGKLTYNDLQKMKYMDMVISETLRMWPPDSQLERVCVKPYDLPPQNDISNIPYKVKTGDDIWIPIYSIHHDAQHHPNPEKFDPERFSPENKHLMNPFTFIPFGVGPRLCIGARFAVMEVKAMIFHLLSHFDIVTTEKTVIPLKLDANTFTLHSENGFWLGLKPRN